MKTRLLIPCCLMAGLLGLAALPVVGQDNPAIAGQNAPELPFAQEKSPLPPPLEKPGRAEKPSSKPASAPVEAPYADPQIPIPVGHKMGKGGSYGGSDQCRAETASRQIHVASKCVKAPVGFCSRLGLDGNEEVAPTKVGGIACHLTRREALMLDALIGANEQVEVITRPEMMLLDGQTATCQVGGAKEVLVGLEAVTQDGKTLYAPKTQNVPFGVSCSVTPKSTGDRSVAMRVQSSVTTVAGREVVIPVTGHAPPFAGSNNAVRPAAYVTPIQPQPKPAFSFIDSTVFNVQQIDTTIEATDGQTIVVGTVVEKEQAQKGTECFWILKVRIIDK
jgi:Bacterial type II and III secretion system protein